MKKLRIPFFIIYLLIIVAPVNAFTPEEILKRVDEIRTPGETFTFNAKLSYRKSAQEDVKVQGFEIRVKGIDKSLVKFIYPPRDKGRLVLMVGNNMWIYIPGTRQPIRISPQQRLLGQVSYGDIARVVFSIDYTAEILSKEFLEEEKCLKLKLTAKDKNTTYAKIILWVSNESFWPRKADFYALSGKCLKVAYYSGYTRVLGEMRPMTLEIHDSLRAGEYSILEYSNMKLDDTPGSFFQKSYLKHIK